MEVTMLEVILNYAFMQRALAAGLLVGLIAPIIGVFLVMRRMSLIADALSHITLTGIAAGMLWNKYNPSMMVSPVLSGMTLSMVGALLIEQVRKLYRFYQELAIPIILAAGIGLGVVLISLADGFNSDLFGYLFGSLVAVSRMDLFLIIVVTVMVLAFVALFYQKMFYISFDEEAAQIAGVETRMINFIFIIMVAGVIAVGMRVVGVLLISSMVTLPVAASMQVAKSFRQTFILAIVFAETAIILGMVLAYYLNWAAGGTIVLFAVLIMILAIGYKKIKRARPLA